MEEPSGKRSKRGATSELNHDNWDQDDDEVEVAGEFVQASKEELSTRVIKKAKRRGAGAQNDGPSIFSGFGGFGAAAAKSSGGAGAFDFLKTAGNGAAAPASTNGGTSSGFSFGNGSAASSTAAAPAAKSTFSFGLASSTGSEASAPTSGFAFGGSPSGNSKEGTSIFGGSAAAPKPSSGFSFGIGSSTSSGKEADKKEDEEKKEKPTTSDESEKPKSGGFDFSGLTPAADEKKSEATTKPASSGGFDFSGLNKPAAAAASSAAKKWTCSECFVTNDADKDNCPCCDALRPGATKKDKPAADLSSSFKFGSGPVATSTNSTAGDTGGFKFGSSSAATTNSTTDTASASSGGFKFGSSSSSESKTAAPAGGGGFKFGSSSSASSATPPVVQEKKPETEEKAVSKVETGDDGVNEKLLVSLATLNKQFCEWIKQHIDKDPYVVLTPCLKDYNTHLEELKKKHGSFESVSASKTDNVTSSATSPEKKSDDTPAPAAGAPKLLGAFFGGAGASAPAPKQTFGSGSTGFASLPAAKESVATSEAPTLSFGSKTDSSSSSGGFAFGSGAAAPTPAALQASPEKPAAPKPAFSFGSAAAAAATASDKPAAATGFSFGSTGSSGFSFGKSDSTASTVPANNSGFSFGTSSSGSGSMFGSAASSAVSKKDDEEGGGGADGGEDEPKDEPPKVEVNTVQEDDAVHSVRCKLFYKKGKGFADKGLGMCHLKKVEGKAQMIVRAETNLGNILLNVVLNESMNFTRRGNNVQFSCVPNPPIKDLEAGPVVMLAKVKNADLAQILEEEIKKLI